MGMVHEGDIAECGGSSTEVVVVVLVGG